MAKKTFLKKNRKKTRIDIFVQQEEAASYIQVIADSLSLDELDLLSKAVKDEAIKNIALKKLLKIYS